MIPVHLGQRDMTRYMVSGNGSNTDGSSTELIAAQGDKQKVVLTDITISNTSTTGVNVEIKDGTTVKWTFPVPAASNGAGGVTHSFETPLVGSANTAWNFDPASAVSTITCSGSGYITSS